VQPTPPPPSSTVPAPSGFGALPTGYPAFTDTVQSVAKAQPASQGSIFDVCHPGLALRAVLYVQAVLCVGVLMWSGSWLQALSQSGPAVFAGLFGTLTWLLLVCAIRQLLGRAGRVWRAVLVLGLGAGCALLGYGTLVPFDLVALAPTRLLAVALGGMLLAGSLWSWLVLRVRSRLPAEAAARLAELQSRIRPHFLFNALNTAVALVRVDPTRAEEVLEDLAQLFRVALEDHGQAVTLDEEVDLARRYLAIEQLRFGDRLRVSWQLDPAAGRAQVPPLLLQPLVENAVRHGVEPSPGGGSIVVKSKVRHGQAVISIVNTVSPHPSRPGHGIALQNVRERLQLLHDVAGQFRVRQDADHYHVQIEIPL
jgi:two-component system sensor histidine kinase AlgZ